MSPVLFSFSVSFALCSIETVPRSVPYVYVDDVFLVITGSQIVPVIQQGCEIMHQFGVFSSLKLNLGKCGSVIKDSFYPDDQTH